MASITRVPQNPCCMCQDCSYVGSWRGHRILGELEDTDVLSEDGASAELLEHLLVPFSQEISVH